MIRGTILDCKATECNVNASEGRVKILTIKTTIVKNSRWIQDRLEMLLSREYESNRFTEPSRATHSAILDILTYSTCESLCATLLPQEAELLM